MGKLDELNSWKIKKNALISQGNVFQSEKIIRRQLQSERKRKEEKERGREREKKETN